MNTNRLKLVLPKSFVFIAALIGVLAASYALKYLAALCFFFLLGNIYLQLKNRYDRFLAAAILFQIMIIQSSAIYIFGQYGFASKSMFVSLFGYASVLGVYIALDRYLKTEPSIQINGSMALIPMLLGCIYALPTWRVIQFLGFGYDNYGHANVIRKILVDRKFFYNELEPATIPSFASNAPMGGHALISFIGQMLGVDGSDYVDFLKFYLFAFALLVVAFIWIAIAIATLDLEGTLTKVLLSVLSIGVLFYTYLSHIWFSGYFASNISTFLMLIGVAVLISNANFAQKMVVLISLIGTSVYMYPLYAIFMFAMSAVILCLKREAIIEQFSKLSLKMVCGLTISLIYFILIAALSMFSMMNGYGSGHFLAPGGIEPMPLGTTMFIFGISLVLLDAKGVFGAALRLASRAVIAMNLIAIGGVLYAFFKLSVPGDKWSVPYYPTKLVISTLIVTVIFLSRYLFEFEISPHNFLKFLDVKKLVILFALGTLFVTSSHRWPFSGGFMGSTNGVIESIRKSRSEVVDGKIIEATMQLADQFQKPVLYLSDAHESELNTRWINSLRFEWNDSNWGEWMEARRLIDEGKFDEAADVVDDKFYLVIDGYSKFSSNPTSFSAFKDICVIDLDRNNSCRNI